MIMEHYLKKTLKKQNKLWLNQALQKQGITKLDNIFLATYDMNGNLSVYLTNNIKNS